MTAVEIILLSLLSLFLTFLGLIYIKPFMPFIAVGLFIYACYALKKEV